MLQQKTVNSASNAGLTLADGKSCNSGAVQYDKHPLKKNYRNYRFTTTHRAQNTTEVRYYLYRWRRTNPGCHSCWKTEVWVWAKPGTYSQTSSQTSASLSTESEYRASCGTGV